MDDARFDAWTRRLAGGLPRRKAVKALVAAGLSGAAIRGTAPTARADGHFGDHCNKKTPCKSPLVCINTECDNCRDAGANCQDGWCCKGSSCQHGFCVKCSHTNRQGIVAAGCKKKKKKHKRR